MSASPPTALVPPCEERLLLRGFGPVVEAELQVRPLTVFIGPQATGKSMTAQLLYFLRGLEELVPTGAEFAEYDEFGELLRDWMGRAVLKLAISPRFRAQWISSAPTTGQPRSFGLTAEGRSYPRDLECIADDDLTERLAAIDRGTPYDLLPEQQIYIPAGRLLCSLVPPGVAISLLSRNRLQWPGYLTLFYEKLEAAIRALPSKPEDSHQGSLDLKGPDERAWKALAEKSHSSLRGSLSKWSKDVAITLEDRHQPKSFWTLPIGNNFASGQLEAWPLWTLVQAHFGSSLVKRIFIEEPEAHLHPSAQRDTVEALVTLLRHRFRFVLTTHSPYVIYALNNALLAGQVAARGRPLPPSVSQDFALAPDQIAVYRFGLDGQVRSIFDPETGLLDTAELDDPAAQLGAQFSALQQLLDPTGMGEDPHEP